MILADPILIGGTGRSGTTITARLLGHHPQIAEMPFEARFLSDADGVPALIQGRITFDEFESVMWSRWFQALYTPPEPPSGGFDRIIGRAALTSLLAEYRADFEADRFVASRSFMRRLLDRVAIDAGKQVWVDASPRNGMCAGMLLRILPRMRMVYLVRDGRDVAASLLKLRWIPTLDDGLKWWASGTRRCYASMRQLPDEAVLVVELEDLTVHRRAETLAALLRFVGVRSDPALRRFFAESMAARSANAGRWAAGLSRDDAIAFSQAYEDVVDGLRRDGIGLLPTS